jgi:hypothetical protein
MDTSLGSPQEIADASEFKYSTINNQQSIIFPFQIRDPFERLPKGSHAENRF